MPISAHARTDAGVLERRQAETKWSGREQDGVASECHGAYFGNNQRGASIASPLLYLYLLSKVSFAFKEFSEFFSQYFSSLFLRIHVIMFRYRLLNSLKVKSTHKMRKTYASRLNACGIPPYYIRESLGHSNLNTTLGYIYNPLTTEETQNLLEKALQPIQ